MRAIYPGHTYALQNLDGDGEQLLQFVQRAPLHEPKQGVTNQEVLRSVIDRVQVLHREVPWFGNEQILYHLRSAIALHESRALLRHIEKHSLPVELAELGQDGHFIISMRRLDHARP